MNQKTGARMTVLDLCRTNSCYPICAALGFGNQIERLQTENFSFHALLSPYSMARKITSFGSLVPRAKELFCT